MFLLETGLLPMDLLELKLPFFTTLVRGSVLYLIVCILLRLIPKRQSGNIAPQDLVGAAIVGGLAVRGISSNDAGPLDNLLLIIVVLIWNYGLNWLAHRIPAFRPWVQEAPTCLVRNGEILTRALRKELLTEEELDALLRKKDVRDLSEVAEAHLEADGTLSVLKKKS